MPALPVPLTGKVISFFVRKTARSMALISSIIFTKTGSRCQRSGIAMASTIVGATLLGPGHIKTRVRGRNSAGGCIGGDDCEPVYNNQIPNEQQGADKKCA